MDKGGERIFQHFAEFDTWRPGPRTSVLVRHRVIDEYLKIELGAAPNASVILIGAGFDTRAFRFPCGRWIELDDVAIIARKEAMLPASRCPNSLHRIGIDFDKDALGEKISECELTENVYVILEGVAYYLSEADIQTLLIILTQQSPTHKLICDLMDDTFLKRYAKKFSDVTSRLGAPFLYAPKRPEKLFLQSGYTLQRKISIASASSQYARPRPLFMLLRLFMPHFRTGYNVFVFNADHQNSGHKITSGVRS